MTEKNNQKVIVRFPPSPTGLLQMGNVRTLIYNYLFARQNGGKFLLRIEDTDKERSKKEYEDEIFDDIEWLGFSYDNESKEKVYFVIETKGDVSNLRPSEQAKIAILFRNKN